jgi:membrane protein insertase Oxa1/YidC/SpoIIIJ
VSAPVKPQRGRAISMRVVVLLTLVVTGFAAAVALWMYWIAGAVIG